MLQAHAVTMASRLKSNLPSMLDDHEAIVAAVDAFERTAEHAGRTELSAVDARSPAPIRTRRYFT
jgi:hypothetical protein